MIISLFLWSVLGLNALHPFHVSVCEVNYNSESKSLQIIHHIFLDDLEQALRKIYDPQLDVVNPKDPEKRDQYVESYIIEHFSIEVNGKPMEVTYLGHELEQDALYGYIEITGVKKMNNISVKDNIMTELFDDQINLVHIKVDGKTKSLKLDKKNDTGQISYTD